MRGVVVAIGLILFASSVMAHTPPGPAAQQTPPRIPTEQLKGTAQLRGRVVSSAGAVSGAVVRLMSANTRARSVTTTDDGRFVFDEVGAGNYRLVVAKSGLMTTTFGAGADGRPIVIADGAAIDRGDLELFAGASISGVILDDRGNPLANAAVQVGRMNYFAPGERSLASAGTAATDASGQYRVGGLPAGKYYVSASASRAVAPTFFPRQADATLASAVSLGARANVSAIDIQLIATPMAKVSGVITNSLGKPGAEMIAWLTASRADGVVFGNENLLAETDAEGRFAMSLVPPGAYDLQVISKARMQAIASSGRSDAGMADAESGSIPVIVDGSDVTDVQVSTAPPAIVSGKVTIDSRRPTADEVKGLLVSITIKTPTPGMAATLVATSALVNADGTFSAQVIPGGRMLRVSGGPAGTALKSVLVNGIDVTDAGFDVNTAGERDVIVAMTTQPSTVTGQVSDSRGARVGDVSVIIFPAAERLWTLARSRVIQTARTTPDGTFAITGLPAGDYYAAVVGTLAEGEWASPTNLESLKLTATAFKLSDGERKALALQIR